MNRIWWAAASVGAVLSLGLAVSVPVLAEYVGSGNDGIIEQGLSTSGGTLTGDLVISGDNQIINNDQVLELCGDGTTAKALGPGSAMCSGAFEVQGVLHANHSVVVGTTGVSSATGVLRLAGVIDMGASNQDWLFAANTSFDQAIMGLGSEMGSQLVLTSDEYYAKDHDHADQTNPTLYIHSATDPDSDNTEWISLTHDQTDGVIDVGSGALKLDAEVEAVGVSGDGTGKVVCVKSDGNLGTCSDQPNGSGVCTCG